MKKAFTLVEILIVVAIVGLLAAIGVPSFINSRQNAETQMRANNIVMINAAKDQWAIVENKPKGTAVNWSDIQPYVGGGSTAQSDLKVGGVNISLNAVGTSAAY